MKDIMYQNYFSISVLKKKWTTKQLIKFSFVKLNVLADKIFLYIENEHFTSTEVISSSYPITSKLINKLMCTYSVFDDFHIYLVRY